jgi:hypothetical protein
MVSYISPARRQRRNQAQQEFVAIYANYTKRFPDSVYLRFFEDNIGNKKLNLQPK